MAKVRFKIRGNSDKETSVYVRLYSGKEYDLQIRTGFTVHPKDWDKQNHMPIVRRNNPKLKNLEAHLQTLSGFLLTKVNDDYSKGIVITKPWLEERVAQCFNRPVKEEIETDNSLINHVDEIIDNAPTRKVKGKSTIGLSKNRVKGYKTFKGVMTRYQTSLGQDIDLSHISAQFVRKLTTWLVEDQNYSTNYTGKIIDDLKAVCRDAVKMEKTVHPYHSKIESFSESKDERDIVTLSLTELEKIKETVLTSPELENTRKWLLLGCEIGQRGSDLLRLTRKNLRFKNGNHFFDLRQKKTKKDITVIVLDPYIVDYINDDFPYSVDIHVFNRYLKSLCKEAGIDQLIQGRKRITTKNADPEKKSKTRIVKGIYPKYEIVSSHICRRSFATNYYKKVPTAILKEITGHSKESQFLEYIGKNQDKDENAMMFKKFYEEIHSDQQPQLRVAK